MNIKRLAELAKHEDAGVREHAADLLEIARVYPHKKKRWRRLAKTHFSLLRRYRQAVGMWYEMDEPIDCSSDGDGIEFWNSDEDQDVSFLSAASFEGAQDGQSPQEDHFQLMQKPDHATIHIDHREECEALVAALRGYGYDIVFEHLTIGDYRILPDTVVERKTIDDFCLSIIDGRLFRQAFLLAEHVDCPVIIVEGESFANRQHDIDLEAIKGALISLAQTFRIPVLRTRDQQDTSWYLHTLAQQRRRVGTGAGALRGTKPKRPQTQRHYILRSIPGVGPKLARLLLEQYETIEAIARVPAEELARMPGLGRKRADSIHNILHEAPAEYRNRPLLITGNSQ